jgi:hypothetical protein
MVVEVKHSGKSMAQRVADRLKSSGAGANPDWMTKHGDGPNRTITHGHNAGHPPAPGTAAKPTDGTVTKPDASKVGGIGR